MSTPEAPPPAGPYSQAISVGRTVYLAGQTPRTPSGERLRDAPFEVQVRQTLDNLESVATAAGSSLHDAVKVTVYLRPEADVADFNAIYTGYVSEPLPARTTIISELTIGAVEVDAVLWLPGEPREPSLDAEVHPAS
ncbi:MAG: Rid family hydrolase [Nocardioidaceae bacterium]